MLDASSAVEMDAVSGKQLAGKSAVLMVDLWVAEKASQEVAEKDLQMVDMKVS